MSRLFDLYINQGLYANKQVILTKLYSQQLLAC